MTCLQDASAGGDTHRQGLPDHHLVKRALSTSVQVLAGTAPRISAWRGRRGHRRSLRWQIASA